MKISNNQTIKSVQEAFQKMFPYLKLQFYTKPHEVGQPSAMTDQINADQTIQDIKTTEGDVDFEVRPDMTIADLETGFAEKCGLYVQVFRRSANLWLQTSKTDHWTLETANSKGGHSAALTSDRYYKEEYKG